MPKGKPTAGTRQPGGGRKPLPPEQKTIVKSYRATREEHNKLKATLAEIRASRRAGIEARAEKAEGEETKE